MLLKLRRTLKPGIITLSTIYIYPGLLCLDTNSDQISKAQFLERLSTGDYIPVETKIENKVPTYQLYKLTNIDEDIKSTISQMALIETSHYEMEG